MAEQKADTEVATPRKRKWTLDELEGTHPLPEADGLHILYPWAWRIDDSGPVAFEVGPAEPNEVWVDHHGCLASGDGEPPAAVAVAVIFAAHGMDSLSTMADELERRSQAARADAVANGDWSELLAAACDAEANVYREAAAMLRCGRVDGPDRK